MLLNIILVCAVLSIFSCVSGGAIPTENKCPGILHEVRLTDCTAYPCKIQKGKEYTAEIEFTPAVNINATSIKCDTVYYGQAYKIPEHPICPDLTPEKCPINNYTKYTYTVKFNVAYFVPSGQYPIRCGILDDNKSEQICLQGVGIVV